MPKNNGYWEEFPEGWIGERTMVTTPLRPEVFEKYHLQHCTFCQSEGGQNPNECKPSLKTTSKASKAAQQSPRIHPECYGHFIIQGMRFGFPIPLTDQAWASKPISAPWYEPDPEDWEELTNPAKEEGRRVTRSPTQAGLSPDDIWAAGSFVVQKRLFTEILSSKKRTVVDFSRTINPFVPDWPFYLPSIPEVKVWQMYYLMGLLASLTSPQLSWPCLSTQNIGIFWEVDVVRTTPWYIPASP
jgi:hypothetical protein